MSDESQRILVVDDDATVSDVVRRYLELAGFAVDVAATGSGAVERAASHPPALVVLDLMLPDISGLDVCRRIRAKSSVPIVMLTALGEEADRVVGLQLGADDYVTKPFSPRELTLRVRSVLRRTASPPPSTGKVHTDGDLVVDVGARRATRAGAEIELTVREFDLLAYLLEHPGEAFSRADLLSAVWGWSFGDHATVTVHVRRLRSKIEADPAHPQRIQTVWGVGYRYEPIAVGAT